jgi:ATP-dependent Clp protease ATP-binding subunit ClpA
MFERLTTQAREVVIAAQQEARQLGHRHVGTEHLLLAMLDPHRGGAAAMLAAAGLDHGQVSAGITRLVGAPQLGDGDAAALRSIGIDLEAIRAKLEQTFGPGALDCEPPVRPRGMFRRRNPQPQPLTGRTPFTPRAKKVLELSLREALRLSHKYIGTEHILLGLIREGDGLAAKIMVDAGINLSDLRLRTEESLKKAA